MHGLKNRAIAGILTGNQLSKIASRKLKPPAIRYLSRSLRPSGRDEARFNNFYVSFPHSHQDPGNNKISAIIPAVLKIPPRNFPPQLLSETLLFGSHDKKRPNCPGPKSKAPPTCPPPKPPCPPKCPPPEAPKCPPEPPKCPPKPCPPPQTPKCPPEPPKCPPKPCPPPQTPKCPPEPPKCPPKPCPPPQTPKCPPEPPKCPPKPCPPPQTPKCPPKPCPPPQTPKCPPKPPKKSCLSVFLPVQEKSVVDSVNSVDDFLGSAGEFSALKYENLVSKSEIEFGGRKSRGKCGKTRRKKPRGCGSGGKKKNGIKKSKKRDSFGTIKKESGNVKPRKLCGPVKEDDPNFTSDRYL